MQSIAQKKIAELVATTRILVVEDDHYMRKVIRSLLMAIGVKKIDEVADGRSGLEAIGTMQPDLVILDWELPDTNGAAFMRAVRSPETFPLPGVPVIMLTGYVERERVIEAIKLGVNEFLAKPVSAKMLFDRIASIRVNPRPLVRIGDYYGPEPRKLVLEPIQPIAAEPTEPVWLS